MRMKTPLGQSMEALEESERIREPYILYNFLQEVEVVEVFGIVLRPKKNILPKNFNRKK